MARLAPMIHSVNITNFKCFRELSLSGFGRLNVIVGDNASGKTAFLEAIYLSQTGRPAVRKS